MNVELEHDDLIDLGTASVETRGSPVGMDDSQGGRNPFPGLSEE
ncbi:MAG TPA: benenodin family lasso peptide [Sphingomicrobium sp.]|nr:benenodin family lasso peptide [Sphingomicrobium sp.]